MASRISNNKSRLSCLSFGDLATWGGKEKSVYETATVLAQSVERVDYRAGGRGFDSRGRTNTQGLKLTEK